MHVLTEVLRARLGSRERRLGGRGGDRVVEDVGGRDRCSLLRIDVPSSLHAQQRRVAADISSGRVAGRVGRARCLDDRRQVAGLRQADGTDVFAEVRPRCGLHAVGASTEVDRVEVALEDLALRQLPLELHGQRRLLHLPGERALLAEVHVLHVLLSQRRPALQVLASQVSEGGPHDSQGVDATVFEEPFVLGGNDSIDEHVGHGGQTYVDPVHPAGEGSELHTVGVVQEAGLRLDLLGWERHAHEQVGRAGRAGEDQEAGHEEQTPIAPDP